MAMLAMLAREVNDRFLVNERGDLSFFAYFKSSNHLLSIQGVQTNSQCRKINNH